MKRLSAKNLIPATAIALGTTAVMGQPGHAQAYEVNTYPVDVEPVYESAPIDYSYVSPRSQTTQQASPGYHYAYYDIARPEYIL
ncbi:hypothetical protein K9N68_24115 [Kovacikia minuta CCNUW1]|uniref:hypothetical protein n=1 Tax=Kovacikia minuta TaxID=2931930 RepID=UPI001CCAF337|nr:hypothetical protein [Kovacikia minuta]UBF24730.1 hypothetical protein K9N68_24115 [Kovacikia minuta CCNUW1]